VIIDNTVKTPINVTSSTAVPIVLASGLSSGTHTIELVKRTEGNQGDAQFLGFIATSILTPPTPAARRIEFIGDSITCGYGNEGTSQYQTFTAKNENAYLAYGSVAARTLGADQITVAWSGKGVIRNYGGNTTDLIPEIYSRILPYNTTNIWNFSQWIPQVVVINMGTNDFSSGVPDKTTFTNAYANFVKQVRGQYSGAHIYCALGPMLNGSNLTSARDYINTVVSQLKSAGDSKVHFIEFPAQDGSLGYGEDWHPSTATHARMANQLVTQIKTDLGW
jgi:lysophospholipase L1-like esterase